MIDDTVITLLSKKLRFFVNHVNNLFNEENDIMFTIFTMSVYYFNVNMTIQLSNIKNHETVRLYINALSKY